jgi:hypothetical protein
MHRPPILLSFRRQREAGVETKIGEFLVQIGAMTREQVAEVLKLQDNGDARMFGEIAIELGYIDDGALRKYLDRPR